jgi:hypothetical protein
MKLCQLHRFLIGSAVDSGKEGPRVSRDHVERCSDCAAWLREQSAVLRALKQEPMAVAPSPFFERRVMNNLAAEAGTKSRRPWRLTTAAASIALTVSIAAILTLKNDNDFRPPVTGSKSNLRLEEVLPKVDTAELKALPKLDEPLEKEFNLVISDTRNAIRALATSFLPDDVLERK